MAKILIVDDDLNNLCLLKQLLVGEGHQVFAAEQGQAALELARDNSVDAVISDIMMPVMNGFRLCREMKRDEKMKGIPFIFYTATFLEQEDEALGMSLGASRFIVKPMENAALLSLVKQVLDEHSKGILPEPTVPLSNDSVLEMYENSLNRKLIETVENLQKERRALRESERKLREAQEIAQMGHWELDLQTGNLRWSDQTFRLFGFKPQEFQPTFESFFNYIHPDDREMVEQSHRQSLIDTMPCSIDYRLQLADGTVKYVHERRQTQFSEDGNPVYSVGTIQDISSRKQAEEEKDNLQYQLQQVQKIESIGQLAGGVAHDFNNMLGVILGHAELGLLKSEPSSSFHSDFKEILAAAKRSSELTLQLLTFARKQPISPRVLNLNDLVDGMLKMLHRLLGENIQLTWNPAKDIWAVNVDSSQMDQVLANLCVNARDAISGDGNIVIKTENRTIGENDISIEPYVLPGDYVHLSVSDDGCGMDQETQNHIFEPFYTTKKAGQGTGLGLATVFGAVKKSDGYISCSSEPGRGTVFDIYLPRSGAPVTDAEEAAARSETRGTETILLVEDDEMLLRIEQSMLEESGYTVLQAATTDQAEAFAREHPGPIHLLISDMIMPVMNGRKLSSRLVLMRPEMKVILSSGYSAEIISQHGVPTEGIHFLKKPISYQTLTAKVREVLDAR